MKNFELSEAARRVKNEYQRQWRKNNPDKVNQYLQKHWEKKAQQQANDNPNHEVITLHERGLSLRQIADKTGISHTQVSRIIKKCNDDVTQVTK